MSLKNILNPNENNLDITCKNIVCQNLDAQNIISGGNTDINTLYVKELGASLPNIEISINSNTDYNNNDILNVGTLSATNIIGNITYDIIDVNQINNKDFNFIQVNSEMKINDEKLYITDDLVTVSNNDCQIHLRNINDACIFIESDTDNLLETDNPIIVMTQDGGFLAQRIGMGGGGLNNTLMFDQSTSPPSSAPDGYKFTIGNDLTRNGQGIPPTFNTQIDKFEINNTLNKSYQNFDMQANDILNCNQLNVSTLADISGGSGPVVSLTNIDMLNHSITSINQLQFQTVQNDNTETRLLALNTGDNVVEYRTVASIINGTENATFNDLTVNNNVDMTQGQINNVLEINNTSDNISLTTQSNGFLIMGTNNNLALNDGWLSINNPLGSVPPAPGGFQGYIWKNGANLYYKNGADTYNLSRENYFNYAESVGQSTNAGAWVTKVTLNVTVPAGTYKVSSYCAVGNNNNDEITEIRLTEGGITLNNGGSVSKPKINTTFPPAEFVPMNMMFIRILTAGSYTYTVDFRPRTGSGSTGYIRDARIVFEKLNNNI